MHLQLLNKDFYHIAAGNSDLSIASLGNVKLMDV